MMCTSPVWLDKQGIFVPCNHCLSCRLAYAKEWSIRVMNEVDQNKGVACFITLTYADEYLPDDLSIHKDELQRFFKRLRKQVDRIYHKKLKYFACGEYGEHPPVVWWSKTVGRPHYHAIVIGVDCLEMMSILPDVWTKGYFMVKPVLYESVRYVTGYVMKKYNGVKADEVYGNHEIPFRLCSQGIGKEYALSHRERLISDGGYCQQGKVVGMPKYYKNLFIREDLKPIIEANACKGFDDFGKVVQSVKNQSEFFQSVVKKAKQNKEDEYQAFLEYMDKIPPEQIVDEQPFIEFAKWRQSVARLKDLSLKAKNMLYVRSKL